MDETEQKRASEVTWRAVERWASQHVAGRGSYREYDIRTPAERQRDELAATLVVAAALAEDWDAQLRREFRLSAADEPKATDWHSRELRAALHPDPRTTSRPPTGQHDPGSRSRRASTPGPSPPGAG